MRNLILATGITLLIFIYGCAQMLPSGRKMINLTKLPGVKSTASKMIDGNLNTAGGMSHETAGGWIIYSKAAASKFQEAFVIFPSPRYVSQVQVYSKDIQNEHLGKSLRISVKEEGKPDWIVVISEITEKNPQSPFVRRVSKRNVRVIRIQVPAVERGGSSFRIPTLQQVGIQEIKVLGY